MSGMDTLFMAANTTSPSIKVLFLTFSFFADLILNLPCEVNNQTYNNGQTFLTDCRTQCTCQNGRYGCSSLCPQEAISPRCRHPRLLEMPGHCCRQWLCDPPPLQTTNHDNSKDFKQILINEQNISTVSIAEILHDKLQENNQEYDNQGYNSDLMEDANEIQCETKVTPWSGCSSSCGMGLSHRESNLNSLCDTITEARVCQERICPSKGDVEISVEINNDVPETNRCTPSSGHECKATNRLSKPVYFRFGDTCQSRKRYRPKYCGDCWKEGICCRPLLTTTIRVDFTCSFPDEDYSITNEFDYVLENIELGKNFWVHHTNVTQENISLTVNVQWILKCFCEQCDRDSGSEATTNKHILHRVHRTAPP